MSARGVSTTPEPRQPLAGAAVAGVDPAAVTASAARPGASSAATGGRKPAGTRSSARSMRGLTRDHPRPRRRRRPPRDASSTTMSPGRRPRTTCRLVTATPPAIRNAEPTTAPFSTTA